MDPGSSIPPVSSNTKLLRKECPIRNHLISVCVGGGGGGTHFRGHYIVDVTLIRGGGGVSEATVLYPKGCRINMDSHFIINQKCQ